MEPDTAPTKQANNLIYSKAFSLFVAQLKFINPYPTNVENRVSS